MAKKKEAVQVAATETVTSYKGFDKDWKCRGFQYAVGETAVHEGHVGACEGGLHACEDPLHVLRYYRPATSRFAVVEQSGTLSRHDEDSKIASSKLTVKAEIDLAGLIKAAITYRFSKSKPEGEVAKDPNATATASGDSGAATASGYSGAATASGDYGAATASGNSGAAMASGRNGRAKASVGSAIFLAERDSEWKVIAVWAGIAGQDGIKPDTFYKLVGGKPVEV